MFFRLATSVQERGDTPKGIVPLLATFFFPAKSKERKTQGREGRERGGKGNCEKKRDREKRKEGLEEEVKKKIARKVMRRRSDLGEGLQCTLGQSQEITKVKKAFC